MKEKKKEAALSAGLQGEGEIKVWC